MTHIRTIIEFEGKNGKIYSVQFVGTHGNLSAKVYADRYYIGGCRLNSGHANKTQALRAIKSEVLAKYKEEL